MKAYSGTQDMGDSPRLKAGRSIELGSEASVTAIRCSANLISGSSCPTVAEKRTFKVP
jgi:hypothetical protein